MDSGTQIGPGEMRTVLEEGVGQPYSSAGYPPGPAVALAVLHPESRACHSLGDVDGGLGVECERPRHQAALAASQSHEDYHLHKEIFI